MYARDKSSKLAIIDVEGCDDVARQNDVPLRASATNSGTIIADPT